MCQVGMVPGPNRDSAEPQPISLSRVGKLKSGMVSAKELVVGQEYIYKEAPFFFSFILDGIDYTPSKEGLKPEEDEAGWITLYMHITAERKRETIGFRLGHYAYGGMMRIYSKDSYTF